MKVLGYNITKADKVEPKSKNYAKISHLESTSNQIIEEEESLNGKNGNNSSAESYIYREPEIFGIDLQNWRVAVEEAWSNLNPSRVDLMDIYKAMTSYDAQTISAIQQRKLFSMQGDFAFYNEDGTVNEQATKLIKTPSGSTTKWFRNFMSYTLDSIFWGYELVSINQIDGKIVVKKVPERNVLPRKGVILKDAIQRYANNSNVIDYINNPKLNLVTCKISYTDDLNELGLLSGIAPYFFSKCTGSWKMHADKFGMLTRVLKTSSENKDKLVASYKALKNQVRGNYVILGQDEELSFEGDTRSAITIYQDLNNYCDKNIAKIILGQTGTTDEKSFSGSAEIHKEILEAIITSDREFIESVVNDQLINKLQIMGVLPTNIYFGISESVDENLGEMATIVKTLVDSGFKPTRDYIEETFEIELEEVVTTSTPDNNNQGNE